MARHVSDVDRRATEAFWPGYSRTVRDLASGSGVTFVEGGAHELKGVEGSWEIFAAEVAPAGHTDRTRR